jgi:polysaccharide pyruvyl transferase CsaB
VTTIAISGSYGGLNVGDEAILTAMLAALREAVPEAELVVFTRDGEHTSAHHDTDRVVVARELTRAEVLPEIERLDLLLLGGGGLLYDDEAAVYLRDVRLAQEVGVPTMTFAIGAGPLTRPEDRAAVRDVLDRADCITVRETQAKRILEAAGVQHEIVVTADPALLLTPEPFPVELLSVEGVIPRGPLVGLSIREPGGAAPGLSEGAYHELIANAADFIVERFDADILFVPMERTDVRHAHRVMATMEAARRASVLKGDYSPRQILGLMAHLEFAVGMRLHFVIFAALAGVPVIALPYAPKVVGFLEKLGLPAKVMVHEQRPGPLLAHIDQLWDQRADARDVLRHRVAGLTQDARRTTQFALQVLADSRGQHAAAAAAR